MVSKHPIEKHNIRFSGYCAKFSCDRGFGKMELDEILPGLVTWMFSFMQNIVFGIFMIVTVGILRNEGGIPYLKRLWAVFREIPGVKDLMSMLVKRHVKAFIKETSDKMGASFVRGKKILQIPEKGVSVIRAVILVSTCPYKAEM